jgi:MoaA/NifB/PqqE/SkfB family radical SAM enzyme
MLSIENLRRDLVAQYKLVSFVDLAEITERHGSAFHFLKSLRKDSFDHDERIVFYSSHCPTDLIINHLQRAVTSIDISNWFILVCSPYNIKEKLSLANEKYGTDEHCISWYQCNLEATNILKFDTIYPYETLCFSPFNNIELGAGDNVQPCCKYQSSIGNIKNQTLDKIIVSEDSVNLRRLFQQGIKPAACQHCWNVESSGGTSLRQHMLNKFRHIGDLQHIDTPAVRSINIALSNVCNFKCRICNGTLSSSFAAEEIKYTNDVDLKNRLTLTIQENKSNDINDVIKILNPIIDSLETMHWLGGEPFLMKSLPLVLDHLIRTGHSKHINFEVNTNGSIWSDNIIDKLHHFKKVEILLSIDDIGKRFELQRGGVWEQVDFNIKQWAKIQNQNFIIKIAPTVNVQNILYLDQLVEYCQSLQLDIVWWYLETPDEFCIDNMTKTAKDLVYEKYHLHPTQELRNIANRMRLNPAITDSKFLDTIKRFDQRRLQDFSKEHQEIINAMSIR